VRQHRAALRALAGLPTSRPSPRVRAALVTDARWNTARHDLLRRLTRATALTGAGIGSVVVLARVIKVAAGRGAADVQAALVAATPAARATVAASAPAQQRYRFAAAVELDGWSLPATAVAGQPLAVQLNWRLLQPQPAHTTMFLHLLSSDGRVVAQANDALGDSSLAATLGRRSSAVSTVPLALPIGLAAGRYAVDVGLFLDATGKRLLVTAEGNDQARDRVSLGTVQLRRGGQ
jgi:hypothetical protein